MIPSRAYGFRAGAKRARPGMTEVDGWSAATYRLQALEGQPLRVFDAGKIKAADKGFDVRSVAAGQHHNSIDSDSLGIHGLLP